MNGLGTDEETQLCQTCGGETAIDDLDEDLDCHDCQKGKEEDPF
jgi:hypothetical protein